MRKLLLILLLMLGCAAPQQERRSLNVILIVVDTLRYDYPLQLSRLPEDTVYFPRAYSHAPYTGPSHSSLFTCRLPKNHGVTHNTQRLEDSQLTLAEMLREEGYHTAGFVSLGVLMRQYGFSQGFDEYTDIFVDGWEIPGDEMNALILPWVVTSSMKEPFFLFAHYSDPHEAYRVKDEALSAKGNAPIIAREYARRVHLASEHVDALLSALDETGVLRSAIVVVTADHGEGLGQHGWNGHVEHVYDELIRVPLSISYPGAKRGPRPGVFSHIQLIPYLFDILNFNQPTTCDSSEAGHIAETHKPDASSTKYSLIEGWEKTIFTEGGGVVERYNLKSDPHEHNNLARDWVLPRVLIEYMSQDSSEHSLTEHDQDMLRSLGYL